MASRDSPDLDDYQDDAGSRYYRKHQRRKGAPEHIANDKKGGRDYAS